MGTIKFDFYKFSSQFTRAASGTTYAAGDNISGASDEHFELGNPLASDDRRLQSDNTVIDEYSHTKSFTLNWAQLIRSQASPTTNLDGELWIFNQDIGDLTDDAAFSVSLATMRAGFITVVDFPSNLWKGFGNGQVQIVEDINFPITLGTELASGVDGKLYAYLVARNAADFAASEVLDCLIGVSRD